MDQFFTLLLALCPNLTLAQANDLYQAAQPKVNTNQHLGTPMPATGRSVEQWIGYARTLTQVMDRINKREHIFAIKELRTHAGISLLDAKIICDHLRDDYSPSGDRHRIVFY